MRKRVTAENRQSSASAPEAWRRRYNPPMSGLPLLSRLLLLLCLILGQVGAFAHTYSHLTGPVSSDAGNLPNDPPDPCDQCVGFTGLAAGLVAAPHLVPLAGTETAIADHAPVASGAVSPNAPLARAPPLVIP